MDLDTVKKSSITATTAAQTTAALTDAMLADGNMLNAKAVHALIDTAAGDVAIDAAALTALDALTGVEEGDRVVFIKSTNDDNKINFTDPITSFTYDYCNRQSETIAIVKDGANWRLDA